MSDQVQMDEVCPKCGAPLGPVETTPTERQLQRCTNGRWNRETRQTEGCDYVKWLKTEPKELDEKCPKCGEPLLMAVTRFGKKMKKCSTSGWDPTTKTPTGCDYVEWINNSSSEELNEDCPQCGAKLVMFTTNSGKRAKKCSTSGWDKVNRVATGCSYIEWQNSK